MTETSSDFLDAGKPPADTTVVVAMSGGVDSSATAALLVERGYRVVGVTMRLFDHGPAAGPVRPGVCCSGRDIADARRVAERLDIPHYVVDFGEAFARDVIEDFADGYLRGETPIPCVRCNQTVKFRDLLARTSDLGADLLVTGHYVRWRRGADGPEMWRGADHGRDQSYFLFATTRAQLAMLRFPLGGLSKDLTREAARRFALPVAEKPDSQDICFVPGGSYAEVVARLRPEAARPGPIVDLGGRTVGEHKGLIHYTVGQRRGLNLGGEARPLYVVRIEPAQNRLVVGRHEDLARPEIALHGVNWLGAGAGPPEGGVEIEIKVRSMQHPVSARLFGLEGGRARVVPATPHNGVAPGQACVFYADERVLGGGWIAREGN